MEIYKIHFQNVDMMCYNCMTKNGAMGGETHRKYQSSAVPRKKML